MTKGLPGNSVGNLVFRRVFFENGAENHRENKQKDNGDNIPLYNAADRNIFFFTKLCLNIGPFLIDGGLVCTALFQHCGCSLKHGGLGFGNHIRLNNSRKNNIPSDHLNRIG